MRLGIQFWKGLAPECPLAGFQHLGYTTLPRYTEDLLPYRGARDWIGPSHNTGHYWELRWKPKRPGLTGLGNLILRKTSGGFLEPGLCKEAIEKKPPIY